MGKVIWDFKTPFSSVLGGHSIFLNLNLFILIGG